MRNESPPIDPVHYQLLIWRFNIKREKWIIFFFFFGRWLVVIISSFRFVIQFMFSSELFCVCFGAFDLLRLERIYFSSVFLLFHSKKKPFYFSFLILSTLTHHTINIRNTENFGWTKFYWKHVFRSFARSFWSLQVEI